MISISHISTCVWTVVHDNCLLIFKPNSDIKFNNVMMDSSPLYSQPVHPINEDKTRDFSANSRPRPRTQCQHPVKYYIIDLGHARHYDPDNGPPHESPVYGGDLSVPEFLTHPEEPCDPFAVDIYRLGNLIRENFTDVRTYAIFLHGLVTHERIRAINWAMARSMVSTF